MKLTLKPMGFMNWMVRTPEVMPVYLLGAQGQQFRHFVAKGETQQRQLVALRRWLEDRIFDGDEKKGWVIPDEKTVRLKKPYRDLLLEMLTHYKDFAGLATTAEAYNMLKDALEGKAWVVDEDLEDPEEVSGEAVETKSA